jgi:hypothetical protein
VKIEISHTKYFKVSSKEVAVKKYSRVFDKENVEKIVSLSKIIWALFSEIAYQAQNECTDLKKKLKTIFVSFNF